jgi:hypothetical protein
MKNCFGYKSGLLLLPLAVLALAGCSTLGEMPAVDSRSATETAAVLDALAAETVQAMQGGERAPTSIADETDQPTTTQARSSASLTPTTTPTLESIEIEVEVSVDTNCRSGPNINFDYVGALLVGERTQVVARSNVPGYFIVNNPDRPGRTCWLWDRYATIFGDPTRLPMLEAPPTPTPAPASVAGWTFIDVNGNGRRDADESDDGLSGINLVLRVGSCPGGMVGYSAQSDSSGRFSFPNILAASYCLTTDPSGSSLKPGQYSLFLGSGESRDGLNFWRLP